MDWSLTMNGISVLLQHRVIPPLLHLCEPNVDVDFLFYASMSTYYIYHRMASTELTRRQVFLHVQLDSPQCSASTTFVLCSPSSPLASLYRKLSKSADRWIQKCKQFLQTILQQSPHWSRGVLGTCENDDVHVICSPLLEFSSPVLEGGFGYND